MQEAKCLKLLVTSDNLSSINTHNQLKYLYKILLWHISNIISIVFWHTEFKKERHLQRQMELKTL